MTNLGEQQAHDLIAPWYGLFNVATRGDVSAVQEAVLTEDYESCAGYLPGECWGRETSIKVVSNFANTIPDMTFEIREVLSRAIASSYAARSPARRRATCSGCRIPARASGSWPSTSRRSGTAGSPRPITWRTGSPPSASCAPHDHGAGGGRSPFRPNFYGRNAPPCRSPPADLGASVRPNRLIP